MTGNLLDNQTLKKNNVKFQNELKVHINQILYDKKIITENMYLACKEQLLKGCEIDALFYDTK